MIVFAFRTIVYNHFFRLINSTPKENLFKTNNILVLILKLGSIILNVLVRFLTQRNRNGLENVKFLKVMNDIYMRIEKLCQLQFDISIQL